MSLRERRAEQHRQIGRSRCSTHPEARLMMKSGQPWCNECNAPPGSSERVVSETERYLTGDVTQHAAIRSKLRTKYGDMTMTSDTALVLREPTDVELKETGRKFESMVQGFGQDISDADLHLAAQLSTAGFLPQHFNVIHGNLYMNFTGHSFWTKRTFAGNDGGSDHRPMNADERAFYQLGDDEVGVVATYYKIVGGNRIPVATDIGRAGGTRDKGKNPIAMANRPEMAIKRALVRVMRQAAPLGVNIATYDGEVGGVVVEADEQVAIPAETADAVEEPKVVVTPELAAETVSKISELGIEKESIAEFSYLNITGEKAVIAMLSDGYDPNQVAGSVAATIAPPPPAPVRQDGDEDVEELPW